MRISGAVILTILFAAWSETVFATSKPGEVRAGSLPDQLSLPPAERSAVSAEPLKPTSIVAVEGGRLTVLVQDRPLAWIIGEISRQSGIEVAGAETVTAVALSVQIKDIPIDQGLREILKNQDVFFLYEAEERGEEGSEEVKAGSLRAIWVYPKGQGRRIAPIPSEQGGRPGQVAEEGPDAGGVLDRAQAIELLIKRKGEQALDDLLRTLQDRDSSLRERALNAALDYGIPLPTSLLDDLVQYDPSPAVRLLALRAIMNGAEEALIEDPHTKTVAELAMSDPSPEVKGLAKQILDRLDDSRPQEEVEPLRGGQDVQ